MGHLTPLVALVVSKNGPAFLVLNLMCLSVSQEILELIWIKHNLNKLITCPFLNISGNSLPVEALVDVVHHPPDSKVASMDFCQHLILLLLSEDHPPH